MKLSRVLLQPSIIHLPLSVVALCLFVWNNNPKIYSAFRLLRQFQVGYFRFKMFILQYLCLENSFSFVRTRLEASTSAVQSPFIKN